MKLDWLNGLKPRRKHYESDNPTNLRHLRPDGHQLHEQPDAGQLETEVWIGEGTIAGEHGEPDYHGLITHDAEYQEEGAVALEKAL